jgi:hypothetical protein
LSIVRSFVKDVQGIPQRTASSTMWDILVRKYTSLITNIFGDTEVDLANNEFYRNCTADIDATPPLMVKYMDFIDNVRELVQSTNLTYLKVVLLEVAANLTNPDLLQIMQTMGNPETLRTCVWLKRYHVILKVGIGSTEEKERWVSTTKLLSDAQTTLVQANHAYIRMSQSLETLLEQYTHKLRVLAKQVVLYQRGEITMLNLVKHWKPITTQGHVYEFSYAMSEFVQAQNVFSYLSNDVLDNLLNGFRLFWSLELPIYNYTTLFRSRLWMELIEPCNNSYIVIQKELLLNRTTWPPDLDGIFGQLLLLVKQYSKDQRIKITQTYDEWTSTMYALQTHMDVFRHDIVVDEQFLL